MGRDNSFVDGYRKCVEYYGGEKDMLIIEELEIIYSVPNFGEVFYHFIKNIYI